MESSGKCKYTVNSSSDSSYFCERDVPKLAHSWKKHHLESIGIFYDDKHSTVSEIITLLKLKRRNAYWQLPDIVNKVIELTKQLLQCSYEEQEIQFSLAEEVETVISEFESEVDKFKLINSSGLLKEKLNYRVFQRWSVYTVDFLLYLRVFTARLQFVSYSSDMATRKGCFTQLFINFMRIFLLKAELGDAYKGEITVMGRRVSGIPDVRFPCYSAYNRTVQVVTTAEVRHKSQSNKDILFSINDISDTVLGQHGVHLLIERKNSYFRPAVFGIICIGTELIFTYLDIEEDNYVSLQEKEIERRKPCKILYTRPYNFLNFADRCQILELCFWLGYLQSDSYKEMEL